MLFLFLGLVSPAPANPATADTSLSPYFFVENGEEHNAENFPLLDTKVDATISGVFARVTVKQRYTNRGQQPIHARYIFPGSTRAAVHGLTMTIGERIVQAQIQEKHEARRLYEAARQEGKSAALLEQKRPNVFSMNVANIMPGDVIEVELEYTELLRPEDGQYEFVYPTVVGPRYNGQKEDRAANSWVANPYLAEGKKPETAFDINVRLAAGMPLKDVSCASHEVKIDYQSKDSASIALKGGEFGGDRDYILRYRLADKEILSGLLLYEGEDENFFLLMAQPPERPRIDQIPGREYIFIIDISGSMYGFPLDTTKVLMRHLLGGLRPDDRFNMIFFSGGSYLMSPGSVPATEYNIQGALNTLEQCNAQGGTELLPALKDALALPELDGFSRSLVVVTDGYVTVEEQAFDMIRRNLNKSNLFAFGIGSSVNRYLIEGLAKAGKGEPFIVTDPSESLAVAKRLNEYIDSPVLTDISVRFDGFEAYDVEPALFPDLFAKRPLLVFGKWRGKKAGIVTISGTSGSGKYEQRFAVDKVSANPDNAGLRQLWARERVAALSEGDFQQEANRRDIVELGLKYSLLTPHTSFIAVDHVVRNQNGLGNDVNQPLPLPKGVPNSAVGVSQPEQLLVSQWGMHGPEPEFWLLLTLFSLAAALYVPRYIGARRQR